jgi:eukaryotic-like serine/threonine-protein kinase
MQFPEKLNYRFEDVEVDISRGCVLRDGEERHLRGQAFQVLVYLLERRERLVSKSELFDTVWNNTAVTDDVLVQCVTEIRRVIGDDPHRPRFIKTIPKTGYRFIGEVKENGVRQYTEEITHVELEIEEEIETRESPGTWRRSLLVRRSKSSYAIAAALVVLLVTILYFGWPTTSKTTNGALTVIEGRKAVAVMFFENQSKSAELDWLREGLADMLSAGLSRSDKLTVLSRDQLHALLERSESANTNVSVENAADIARQSRAEFLVSGSFAQIGPSVRLDVRLHDGKTGNLMTTESLTVERAEQLLSQIDLLSLKISRRLGAVPNENRDMASVMTDNLEAYRYYSLGVEKAQAYHTDEAVELLQKAVALDPQFAMAHARIGYAYAVTNGFLDKGKPYLEKAFQLSGRLTEKDRMNIAAWYAIAHQDYEMAIGAYREIIQRFPFEVEAYMRLSRLLRGEERFDEAIAVIYQGLAIDTDAGELYNTLGSLLSGQGKNAEAISAHERYVALAPAEPNAYDSLGLSYQRTGDYPKAIENFGRALALDPKFEIAIIHLANAYIGQGRYRDAIAAFNRYIDTVSTDDSNRRGLNGIAYIHLQMGDLNAIEKVAARSGKTKIDAWYEYLIAARRNETAKVKSLEKKILDDIGTYVDRGVRPNLRFEQYHLGAIALINGRNNEAVEHFRQALRHQPPTWNHDDFEDCLGRALLRLGRYEEAIAEFQRILQLNPNYPLAHFHLAEAYNAKGLTDEAGASYRKFLEVWKEADADIPEVLSARKYLGS